MLMKDNDNKELKWGPLQKPLIDLGIEGPVFQDQETIVQRGNQLNYIPQQRIGTVENGRYLQKPILKQYSFSSLPTDDQIQLLLSMRAYYETVDTMNNIPNQPAPSQLQSEPFSIPLSANHINNCEYSTEGNFLVYADTEYNQKMPLTNYYLMPIERIYTYEGDKRCGEEIKLQLYINAKKAEVLNIKVSALKNIHSYISDKYPHVFSNIDASKVATHVETSVRQQVTEKLPVKLKQLLHGWSKITGEMKYFHDGIYSGNVEVSTKNKIVVDKQLYSNNQQLRHTLSQMLNVSNNLSITAPLIATAFLGILFRLFTEAEISPQFAVFIYGASGTMKTSFSKVLFTFFNTDDIQRNKIVSSFKDTVTSYEMRFRESRDSVLLLDDYHPSVDVKNKKAMEVKAEDMIRFVGDGIGKNRSNASLEDVKGNRPEGMLVITGEETLGTNSTLLRTLFIRIQKGDIIPEVLSIFQRNTNWWPTLLQRFIDYIQLHYDDTVAYIRDYIDNLRDKYKSQFNEMRPCDQMVILELTYRILRGFLLDLGCPTSEADIYIANCIDACFVAVKNSYEQCRRNSIEVIYSIALYNCIISNEIHIAKDIKQYECNLSLYQGYLDKVYYVLDSVPVNTKINNYLAKSGNPVYLSESEGVNQLKAAGLLITSKNGKNADGSTKILLKAKVTINGHRFIMLKISKDALENFVSQFIDL